MLRSWTILDELYNPVWTLEGNHLQVWQLATDEQEPVPRKSMQIAVFARKVTEKQSSSHGQSIVTADQVKDPITQSTRVLRRHNKLSVNQKSQKTTSILLTRSLTKIFDPKRFGDRFLLKKGNYKIIVSTGHISFDMLKLPVIVDTGAVPIFFSKNHLT